MAGAGGVCWARESADVLVASGNSLGEMCTEERGSICTIDPLQILFRYSREENSNSGKCLVLIPQRLRDRLNSKARERG